LKQGDGITKIGDVSVETEQVVGTASTSKDKSEGGTAKRGKSSAGRKGGAEKTNVAETASRPKQEVTLKTLLEAGAHFGHQTSRWCPAMAPYIYTSRNGIHIINVPKTVQCWNQSKKAIENIVARGGSVLFVGTKKQAQDAVQEEAKRCGAFYVSQRWLGGMLTNFQTIRKSIERMNKLGATIAEEEATIAAGGHSKFTKKERLMMSREREKLEYSLGGIKDLYSSPSLMFVIDIKREEIAVNEARRLDIPVVALVDTNCNPDSVNYPIPSNDDGSRVIRLFCAAVADAIIEGKRQAGERRGAEASERKAKSDRATESLPEVTAADAGVVESAPAAEAAPADKTEEI